MNRAVLTVKKYRCFSDETPLRIPLGLNTLAFVGANNSGKSAALRLVHELQPLWAKLYGDLTALTSSEFQPGGMRDVPDLDDLFSNSNERDLSLQIDLE